MEALSLDDQIGGYVLALRMLGIPVREFVYHEQAKAFPERRRQNKARRLGRLFSVDKNQPTTHAIVLETVMSQDLDAFEQGLYDEYLQWLKSDGPAFYHRSRVTKTDAELHVVQQNLYAEASEMVNPGVAPLPLEPRRSDEWLLKQTPAALSVSISLQETKVVCRDVSLHFRRVNRGTRLRMLVIITTAAFVRTRYRETAWSAWVRCSSSQGRTPHRVLLC